MLLPDGTRLDESVSAEQSEHRALDPFYAQFRDQSRFWIQRVAVPIIMVIGLFGNLITVIIMTRRRMRSTTNMYLATLALVDMLYLVLTFLLGLSHYPNMAGGEYYLYWRLRPFLMMLTDACSNTSVWLTVTFTIERFIAVKYPMRGKVWCTEARAKRLIVFVFLFGIMFASPVPFEWKVVEKPARKEQTKQLESVNVTEFARELLSDTSSFTSAQRSQDDKLDEISRFINSKQQSIPLAGTQTDNDAQRQYQSGQQRPRSDEIAYILTLENSDFGRNETYKTIYYWSTAVIFYFIPLLSLTFFNGFLILSVHHSLRERNRMTTGRQSGGGGSNARNQIHCQAQSREARVKGEKLREKDRRLVIPKIAIGTRELAGALDENGFGENGPVELRANKRGQPCQAATDGTGNVVRHHKRDKTDFGSDSCQHKLISKSDLDISSTDKMDNTRCELDSPGEAAAVDQHEITRTSSGTISSENSSRVYMEKRVEFSCDSDRVDDESLNVQTNCDNTNNNNLDCTVVTHQGNGANRIDCKGRDEAKFAIVVPILRINHGHENSTEKALPVADVEKRENQLAASPATAHDAVNKHADNKLESTASSGSMEDSEHPKLYIAASTTDDKSTAINVGKNANNQDACHSDNVQSNDRHGGEKFQLINASAGGGGGNNSNGSGSFALSQCNNNYESGSCTTIQTANSLVPISTQERRITIMLIAVVILFLCCQIPSAAMLLYTSVRDPAPNTNEHALVLAFGNIFNFLMAVNAAGNFILYSFLSKKYRRTFMILFCNCFQRRNSSSEKRSKATRFCSSQFSSCHQTAQPGVLMDDSRSRRSIDHLKRWSNAGFLRSKLGLRQQVTLQSDDIGNHLVKGSFAKHQKRDTLV